MSTSVPTKKDLALKLLIRHRDVTASIFNAVIYDGKPVIRKSDLCDRTQVTSYNTGTVLHGLYRDITKILKKEHVKLCIVSVENQSHIDKHIVFRNAGYDGGDYRDQAEAPGDPVPVVTIVLYSNRENTPSIGATGLHRMGGDESCFFLVLRYWFVSGFEEMCRLCIAVLEVFVISDIISVISLLWHKFCKR